MHKKILIVEDDRSLQSALAAMLEKHHYVTISAFDGETGLAAAQEEKPDLILLDIVLPKKDGFAFMAGMQGNPAIASIPVIVLTNLEDSADIERALGLGARTFLIKTNYQLEEIAEKIEQTLQ
jgi:DNA-binding response OmpR family regulator